MTDSVRERERHQDFQTAILLDYFDQTNRDEIEVDELGVMVKAEILAKLREKLADGSLQIGWMRVVEEPTVFDYGDEEKRAVGALLPEWLFDLISKDSELFYQLKGSPLTKGRNWLANRLGTLLGFEGPGDIPSKLESCIQKQRVEKETREVVKQMVKLLATI